ncbi:hypothetical protein MAN88_35440 [Microcystis aeruginosa]|nr:hypothetical protein MAN88_35440 [Microcystis aeruginosa]
MADALKATGLSYSLCDKFIAIPIVVRYRVLGFEESVAGRQESGFGIQELRFWCTS